MKCESKVLLNKIVTKIINNYYRFLIYLRTENMDAYQLFVLHKYLFLPYPVRSNNDEIKHENRGPLDILTTSRTPQPNPRTIVPIWAFNYCASLLKILN
jgi:hypothetical protein